MKEKSTMRERIRVLHLEDNLHDAELIRATIEANGIDCEFVHARNRQEFEGALVRNSPFDLVLSDYSVPDYDGFAALKYTQEKSPNTPFILLSGTLDEGQAVESLKSGATDYIIKHRLTRLAPAICRALDETKEKAAYKRAEERLREQAALLDKARDAILACTLDGLITFWNRGAEMIYGWTASEALGKNFEELLSHPGSPQIKEARKRLLERGDWSGELSQFTKAGKWIVIRSHWTCVRDQEDRPDSILVINSDITEQKQMESQYLRAQRLECIGILASGIAHDLNNVLAPILMGSQLIRMTVTDADAIQSVDAIEKSAQHGAELIKQILAFGRGVGGEQIEMQAGHVIRDVNKLIADTLPRSIDIRLHIPKELWTVKAVSTQLHQVLMNLCVNARDAMPDGGRLEIRAENIVIDEHYANVHPEAKAGPFVVMTVTDTGTGMPPEVIEKIYDPFFTTKEIGKGTGLGLATVSNIVKSHEGFIHVYSEPGKGTRFRIYIPAVEGVASATIQRNERNLPKGNGECILVVDDELEVRRITATTLERYGYTIITAKDGADGLATYVARQQDIALVLTDMMMPMMGGAPLIQALRRINPAVKIVVLSGMVESVDHDVVEEIKVISKPFTTEQLLVAIQQEMADVPA